MWLFKRNSKPKLKQSSRAATRRRLLPTVEALEDRRLLATGTGFLQGIAFIDANGDNQLDPGEQRKKDATIELRSPGGTLLDTTMTDIDGIYRFSNLMPGTYRLIEKPPLGFANQGVQIQSQLNPGMPIAPDTIEVTLVDPEMPTELLNTYVSRGPGQATTFSLVGGVLNPYTNIFTGQFNIQLSGGSLPGPTPLFPSYCVDLLNPASVGNVYHVIPTPTDPILGPNAGRIAYLYNHIGVNGFGSITTANNIAAAGFQLALYELRYDTTDDLANGNFKLLNPNPTTMPTDPVVLAAQGYLSQSIGQKELAIYLDGSGDGKQAMLTTGSFNFANTTALGSIHGYGYEDLDADGVLDTTDVAWNVPGVSPKKIDLYQADGTTFITSAMTDTNGQFWFLSLAPGTYVLKEDLSVFTTDPHVMPSPGATTARTVTILSGQELVYKDGAATGMLKDGQYEELVNDGRLVFGNFLKGSIHGFGYEDLDADGILDTTDVAWSVPGVAAKKIDLYQADGTTLITSAMTDTNGQFWFLSLAPGTYVLKEDLSVFSTDPHVMPSPGATTARTVTILSGQELVYKDGAATGMLKDGQEEVLVNDGRLVFGNFLKGSIHGFGYEDKDADGVLDTTDVAWNVPGLPKKIDLYQADGTTLITSATTDANGQFWFLNLAPGTYVLKEDLSVLPSNIMPSPDPDGPGGIPGGAAARTATILSGQELVYKDGAAAGMLKDGQEEVLVNDGRLVFGNFFKPSPGPAVIDIEKYVKPVVCDDKGDGEGLTPGYWKQEHHFDDWTAPYDPTDNYNATFGLTGYKKDDPTLTLLGALERGGGGKNALGRHAVAALLNSVHDQIEYAYTEAQVIALVKNAYMTLNFEAVKDQLAVENEKGANLNDGGSSTPPTSDYGFDADEPTGPKVPVYSKVMFTYVVTNPGQTVLANVVVKDDNETPDNPADDFMPAPVLAGGFNVGDEDKNGLLDPGEVWLYTAMKIVKAGQHTNIGKVTANPVDANGNPTSDIVMDTDPANWFGKTVCDDDKDSRSGDRCKGDKDSQSKDFCKGDKDSQSKDFCKGDKDSQSKDFCKGDKDSQSKDFCKGDKDSRSKDFCKGDKDSRSKDFCKGDKDSRSKDYQKPKCDDKKDYQKPKCDDKKDYQKPGKKC